MLIVHMLARFKSFLLSLITLFRRALCCFSRRRRPSYSECEILTSVNVVQSNQNTRSREEGERDWNSWDDSPRTVSEHIEQYRQKLVQPQSIESDGPTIDFFQDMIPKVVRQQKIFIATDKDEPQNFSRLQATSAAHIPHFQSAELEDLSDENADENNADNQTGWDVINDEMAKQIIREKRREARAQRNQRVQQQKLQQHQTQSNLYAHR